MTRNSPLTAAGAVVAAFQLIGQAMSQPNCDLMKIAQERIAKQYPSFDPVGLKLVFLNRDTCGR